MIRYGLGIFSVLVLTQACSNKPKPAEKAPTQGYTSFSEGSFQLRPFKEETLENGLKIFFIHDASLPRVSLHLLVKVGVPQDPKGAEGLNALTAEMLAQGTQTRSATKLADEFGQLGTEIKIIPGPDFTMVSTDGLSTSAPQLLGLFSDVVMNPAFSDAEVARLKSRVLANIKRIVDDPSAYADDQMSHYLYGANPYAFDAMGGSESVRKLNKQRVIRHYLTHYRPNNATLAIVGRYDAAFEQQVKDSFSKWTQRQQPSLKMTAVENPQGVQVRLITKKNLQQTQIRISQIGIPRNDADFLKLRVANEILGGSFASRLNQKVRDDLGLTYSIYSGFDSLAKTGSFDIKTFTKNETAGKTLQESLNVLREFVDKGVSEKELQAAKSLLIGQFPRAIETADKTAFNFLALDFYGIPRTYLTQYNKNIEKITLKEVNEVIKKRISSQNMKILIYADGKVAEQIKEYKPEVSTATVP